MNDPSRDSSCTACPECWNGYATCGGGYCRFDRKYNLCGDRDNWAEFENCGGRWTCDWSCPNNPVNLGLLAGGPIGRRRQEQEDVDQALCTAVTAHATQLATFANIIKAIESGDSVDVHEIQLAEEVAEWCDEQEQLAEGGRRRTTDYGDLSGRLERYRNTSDLDWQRYRTLSHIQMNSTSRRLQDPIHEARRRTEALPADIWYQCRGYAIAAAQLIASLSDEAANTFVMKANSNDLQDRLEACGSIVNHVNDAVINAEIPGVELLTEETIGEGVHEIVATYGQIAVTTSEAIGSVFGLEKLEVAFAGSASLVYALFAICKSYEALLP